MWIFTRNGFLSIVQDTNNEDRYCVRARFAGHIESVFGNNVNVIENAGTDYAYRAFIEKEKVQKEILRELEGVTYSNFKKSVHAEHKAREDARRKRDASEIVDRQYLRSLSEVWSVLSYAQDRVAQLIRENV